MVLNSGGVMSNFSDEIFKALEDIKRVSTKEDLSDEQLEVLLLSALLEEEV